VAVTFSVIVLKDCQTVLETAPTTKKNGGGNNIINNLNSNQRTKQMQNIQIKSSVKQQF